MSLRDQLQQIYESRGELTPQVLVDEARPKTHPLHDRFLWDNVEAAEAWRRVQAHELIRSVRIVYQEANETRPEKTIRAFQAVQSETGYQYEPVEAIAADPFKRALLLQTMEREWRAMKDRYETFDEFWQLLRGEVA